MHLNRIWRWITTPDSVFVRLILKYKLFGSIHTANAYIWVQWFTKFNVVYGKKVNVILLKGNLEGTFQSAQWEKGESFSRLKKKKKNYKNLNFFVIFFANNIVSNSLFLKNRIKTLYSFKLFVNYLYEIKSFVELIYCWFILWSFSHSNQ